MNNTVVNITLNNDYQNFIDTLPSLLWISDKSANPVYFNKAWLNFTGKKTTTEAKKTWKQLIHEDDLKYTKKLREDAHSQQRGYELKYRLWNEDNHRYLWTKELGEPRFENEKFTGFIINCTDIQEHYDLIVNLSESEARYKELYNNTPVMLHSINSDGRIISVSDYWLEKMGYSREEALGMFSSDFLTDESKKIAKTKALPKFFKEGKITNQNYQFVKKNGETMDVLLSAIAEYHDDRFVRSLAVINDITDIKKTDEFLQKIFSITSNTKVTLSNKIAAMLEITTKFLDLEIGIVSHIDKDKYTIKYLYAPETDYAVGQTFPISDVLCRHAHETNSVQSWANLSKAKDICNSSDLMSYIGMPLLVDEEKYGTLCFCSTATKEKGFEERDHSIINLISNWISTKLSLLELIKELKESQSDLSQLVEELQSSNTELERFAYVAAHDLQEPIRSLRNFTTLLSKKYKNSEAEEEKEYVEIIHDAAARMQKLVSDLLDYSRIETEGKNYEEFELDDVLDYVQSNLMDLMRVSNAQLNYKTEMKIKTDPVKLSRLLQNLISNGIKYTKNDSKPIINVTCQNKKNHWEFCVQDNGIGIDSKYYKRIFAPFKRLHSKDLYPGSGIGLAICNKIVDSLGGKIWVESEENKGSKFFFSLPKTK